MLRDWQRLEREVERVHRRYQVEVVEALNLCPWARDARLSGRVQMRVSFMSEPDSAEAWSQVVAAMRAPEAEVGILVFPALDLGRLAFSHFVATLRVRESEANLNTPGAERIALADFHPDASADTVSAERLVPFLRRAPDPMVQIVRQSALENVRLSEAQGTSFVDPSQYNLATMLSLPAAPPALATRVARNNARTVERMGVAQLEALVADILNDRHASYAALGLPLPAWAAGGEVVTPSRANLEKPET
jgi:hypothetical protein